MPHEKQFHEMSKAEVDHALEKRMTDPEHVAKVKHAHGGKPHGFNSDVPMDKHERAKQDGER